MIVNKKERAASVARAIALMKAAETAHAKISTAIGDRTREEEETQQQ